MRIVYVDPIENILKIISPAEGVDINSLVGLVPEGLEYKIVDVSELPTTREFRNAWSYDLSIDLPKAKEITKKRLRAEREPLLKAEDVKLLIALEKGESLTEISTEKQRLRDITKEVDKADTIEALKDIKCH